MTPEKLSPSPRLPERLEAVGVQLQPPQAGAAKGPSPASTAPAAAPPTAPVEAAAAAASLLVPARQASSDAVAQAAAEAPESLFDDTPDSATAAPTSGEPSAAPSGPAGSPTTAATASPVGRPSSSSVIDLCSEDECSDAGVSDAAVVPAAAAAPAAMEGGRSAAGAAAAAGKEAVQVDSVAAPAAGGNAGLPTGQQDEQEQQGRQQQGCSSPAASLQARADSELPALAAVRTTADALVDACVADAAAGLDLNCAGQQEEEERRQQQQQQPQPQPQPQPGPSMSPRKLSEMSPAQQRLAQSVQQLRWWQAAILDPLPPSAGMPSAAAPSAAVSAASAHGEAAAATARADASAGEASAASAPALPAAAEAAGSPAAGPPSAAAAAAAGGSPGAAGAAGGAATAGTPGSAEAGEEDPMPDPSDTVAMLHWLRARIPQHLLDEYREPFQISEQDKAVTEERLAEFEAEVKRAIKSRRVQAKFDLNAASQMPTLHPEWGLWDPTYGHKPGTYPGQKFAGRGALQALGVHTNYYGGIQSRKEDPAFAICLSGGYEDDDDHGDWLWYTGKGGRDSNGVQVQSQSFTHANAAIRACMEQGKPLRVCRGFHVETTEVDKKTGREKTVKQLQYTYDGLYAVIRAELCDSENSKKKNIKVCRYLMVGIPGHYKANRSISFVELRGFRNMRLAGARSGGTDDEGSEEEEEEEEEAAYDDWQRYPKRRRTTVQQAAAAAAAAAATVAAAAAPKRKRPRQAARHADDLPAPPPPVVQDAAWLAAQRARLGFLTEDISGGVESRMIPAFNEVDDAALDELEYVKDSKFGSEAARKLAEAAHALMPASWCGLKKNYKNGATWTPDGVMDFTDYRGRWECCGDARVCSTPECKSNRVISEHGISQPLELFRTRWKGWGVRCAVHLLPGTFVATYEGELITTQEAEERRGGDTYFFDLHHFVLMHQDPGISARQKQLLPPLPPLPASCEQDGDDHQDHLVIDALQIGNIARYINHSCKPNLVVQPVLRPGDSGLKYGVTLVAQRLIEAGEELTYSYGYKVGSVPDKEIPCYCGAKGCKGRLL
ncbi:hypothetical protein ABPG75_013464 [Micractinium tetrahymenae]